jgi:hypothetical protein
MKKSSTIILLFCGIVFGLAAFPVFAQGEKEEVVRETVINKRVLRDFADYFKTRFEKGEIDLDKSFKVVVEGILTKDGRFDITLDKTTGKPKTQFTYSEGDAQMVETAKIAIEAVGDSGFLGYLRNFGVEQIKFTLAQDGQSFSANLESEMKDENKARTLASGLNVLVKATESNVNLREDEKILINGMKAESSGNNFILNFALPKKTFHEILLRNLNISGNNKTAGE